MRSELYSGFILFVALRYSIQKRSTKLASQPICLDVFVVVGKVRYTRQVLTFQGVYSSAERILIAHITVLRPSLLSVECKVSRLAVAKLWCRIVFI